MHVLSRIQDPRRVGKNDGNFHQTTVLNTAISISGRFKVKLIGISTAENGKPRLRGSTDHVRLPFQSAINTEVCHIYFLNILIGDQ